METHTSAQIRRSDALVIINVNIDWSVRVSVQLVCGLQERNEHGILC